MTKPRQQGWIVFDEAMPILVHEYSFGPDVANALAVGTPNGLMVISPPCRAAATVFGELEQFGAVRALVAPNAYHTMGLAEWRARFPEALLFAPAQSIARVEKQSRVNGFKPIAEAASLAGSDIEFVDMPYYKTGEVLVRMTTSRGLAWYVTDVIFNLPALPGNLFAKLAFGLSRSAPGLRFNNIAPLFMVADKAALRRWLAEEFRKAPPRWLIPAHGAIVDAEVDSDGMRNLFSPR